MKLTQRDRVLMLILPGLAVFMIYVLVYFTTQHRELGKLQTELTKAKERQPGEGQSALARDKSREADARLTAAKKEQAALQGRWMEQAEPWLAHGGQNDRLTKLLAMLRRHRLHLVDHVPAENVKETHRLRISPQIEKLGKQIAERGKVQPPQLWRMHLIGSYADVLQSLQELSSGPPLAIPVALSMKEPENLNSARQWFILVWI